VLERCLWLSTLVDPTLAGVARDMFLRAAGACHNAQVTARRRRRTAVAASCVPGAGVGLFLLEPALRGDLVAEYVGEAVDPDETSRHGVVHDRLGTSYAFGRDAETDVDSMRCGNKSRFVNNSHWRGDEAAVAAASAAAAARGADASTSRGGRGGRAGRGRGRRSAADSDPAAAACAALQTAAAAYRIVGGQVRIGLFATRDLPAGAELFFDYGERFGNVTAAQEGAAAPAPGALGHPAGRVGAGAAAGDDDGDWDYEDGRGRQKARAAKRRRASSR